MGRHRSKNKPKSNLKKLVKRYQPGGISKGKALGTRLDISISCQKQNTQQPFGMRFTAVTCLK